MTPTLGLDSRVQLGISNSSVEIIDNDMGRLQIFLWFVTVVIRIIGLGATVELEITSTNITEGDVVRVCAAVRTDGSSGCAVGFDFAVILSVSGSAGNVF